MEELVERATKLVEGLREVESAMREIDEAKRELVSAFEDELKIFDGYFKYSTKIVVPVNREVEATKLMKWLDYARRCECGVDGAYRLERRGALRKVIVESLRLDNEGVDVDVTLVYRNKWGDETAVSEYYKAYFRKATKLGALATMALLVEEKDMDELVERAREEAREVKEVAERLREVMAVVKLLLQG